MPGIQFAIALEPDIDERWHLARQMGLDHAVAISGPRHDIPLWDYPTAVLMVQRYRDFGFEPSVFEGWLPMDAIKRGGPEREAEMAQVLAAIRNLGAIGVKVLCYNWMAFFNWARTSFTTPARGGALTSSYDHALTEAAPEARTERISREALWETFAWFLERAIPVAEKAGLRLSLHPDDPPLPKVLGVPRLFGSPEAFERAMGMADSEANSICFCQGNFAAMGVDVPAVIRRLADRVSFVHFRDVRGTAEKFVETFHDEGPTDMFAAMRAWHEAGYRGVMRPDHAPAMYGDPNLKPGYEARGRLFAIGYMRGLLEGVEKTSAIRNA
jgi:mannonate dehydratase